MVPTQNVWIMKQTDYWRLDRRVMAVQQLLQSKVWWMSRGYFYS